VGRSRVSKAVLAVLGLAVLIAPQPSDGLPALPAGWPATLQIGMSDPPGGAAQLRATTGAGFRYQYLSGGVNTGSGWANWNSNGSFVTLYIQESIQQGIIPVFSYYMLLRSTPGSWQGEPAGLFGNLQNTATMQAYYADLTLFFQRAGAFPGRAVVLHVEPDLWAYMQQQRAVADDPATVPVRVAATGVPELAGLPDNAAGLARAIANLRDRYAPNVLLAYHLSVWGTSFGIAGGNPPDATVNAHATRAAAFFTALGGRFDLVFADLSDRDAGYYQHVVGDGGGSWWDASDFPRFARYLGTFVASAGKRVVLWQIPLGNTRMRAVNNTWHHYQDNRVEWFLDDPSRAHLAEYVQAGVVAFLFGRGADGNTCACDASGDGVTNPAAINGNTRLSVSADDDGGFFRERAAAYYAAGVLPLGSPPPPPWAVPSIDALWRTGITSGCTPTDFCAHLPVTRAQLAIFLLRARHGGSHAPPAARGGVYRDVPAWHWAAPWIEQLAAHGMTVGCGGGNYCPDSFVTRAEMAVLLLRASHGADYVPPSPTGRFTDVPATAWAAAWIEGLAADGITTGCAPSRFCPGRTVTRAEMALFLVRAFGISL